MEGLEIVEGFREHFYSLVSQIPEGKVATYGTLAEALGDKIAARAVGTMLNQNPNPIEIPCHRVVRSDGSLGGYGKGEEKKRGLLKKEGIKVKGGKLLNFEQVLFEEFESDQPLKDLRKIQNKLKGKVSTVDSFQNITTVGGLDVSYSHPKAFAALSIWDENEEMDNFTLKCEMTFPYIPTYLAFRELPCLLEVLRVAEKDPDLLLVDGNGVMHPKRAGLASHLGVECGIPTIGVAKSKLCGRVVDKVNRQNRVSKIKEDDELVGHAVLEGNRAKNPIYVSPGHLVSHEEAVEIVRDYCTHKVPEPIRRAHIEANKRRKEDG